MADTTPISPVVGAHRTYATLAERAIREMIADGRLVPGMRVNEVELAESLQISRGPLREAIQRLASEGLLTAKSHRGAYVKEVSELELRELYELRMALETFALRIGAKRSGEAQRDSLSSLLTETRQLLDAKEKELQAPDLEFHRRIVELSGNATLAQAHGHVLQQIALARSRATHDTRLVHRALEQHIEVLEHVVAGDIEAATQALEKHLSTSLNEALALLGASVTV